MKTVLITGATDGIGLVTAKTFLSQGHHVILHGRNNTKLQHVKDELASQFEGAKIDGYIADFSNLSEVKALANQLLSDYAHLDVLINNAGIFRSADPITATGEDIRFVVNTLAPALLTQSLQSILDQSSRVVSLSSAAQAPVDIAALEGKVAVGDDFSAYAQSKLALTMWSAQMGAETQPEGPTFIALNPGSMLGSKMVKEGFGVAGNDIQIGADVLVAASLDKAFGSKSGEYFDNDCGAFAAPHVDAKDTEKVSAVVKTIHTLISRFA